MRDRILQWVASVVWRKPIAIIVIAALLAIVSLIYAGATIKLNANTDDLIAPDRPYMREYLRFLEEFGDLEYIYAVVENSGDPARARAVVDALTEKLRQIGGLPGVFSAI